MCGIKRRVLCLFENITQYLLKKRARLEYLVISADIDVDRQTPARVNSCQGDVQSQFADRNADSVCAQITQTQNALSVRDDNCLERSNYHLVIHLKTDLDVLRLPVAENLIDLADAVVVDRHIQTSAKLFFSHSSQDRASELYCSRFTDEKI